MSRLQRLSGRSALGWTSRSSVMVLASFAIVVACFGASSLYSDLRLQNVASSAENVSSNSLPSIVHLAEIRTTLHDLDEVTEDALVPPYRGATPIDRALTSLRTSCALYEKLPTYRGESALWLPIRTNLDIVEARAGALAAELHGPRETMPDAEHLHMERAELREQVARIDAALRELVEFNALQGNLVTSQLDTERQRIRLVGFLLDGVSLLVSIALAVLAARAVRRYTGLVERRAEELESFANRVAHDVRGPLTPALGALEIAHKKLTEDHELSPVLARGIRSVRLVESIVEDLLVFARAGAQPEPGAYADFRSAVEEVLNECQPYATARRVQLRAETLPDVAVRCAPGLLASVLSNLVRNAIKYIDERADNAASVVVRARVERDRVLCEVLDTGPGIPPAMQRAIFLPHVRLDRRTSGLGLGLATVDRVIRAHGGQVGVSPNPKGQGSRFWFELPQATDAR
ncbi:MAG TPA: HAMP domain-containing sensor histidine kinase [Polyangiaceae bacterium]|nr:HAMP domain-containing sensor histidine kinase [Polyangiaceae bacterium]